MGRKIQDTCLRWFYCKGVGEMSGLNREWALGFWKENKPLLMFAVDMGWNSMPIAHWPSRVWMLGLFVNQGNLSNLPPLLWFLFLPLRPPEHLWHLFSEALTALTEQSWSGFLQQTSSSAGAHGHIWLATTVFLVANFSYQFLRLRILGLERWAQWLKALGCSSGGLKF